MEGPDSRNPIAKAFFVGVALVLPLLCGVVRAQSEIPETAPLPGTSRIDRLEQTLQSVVEENRRLAAEVRSLKEQLRLRPPETQAPAEPPAPGPPLAFAPAPDRRSRVLKNSPPSIGWTTTTASRSSRRTSTTPRSRSGSGARTCSVTTASPAGRRSGPTAPATGSRSTTATTSGSPAAGSSSRGRCSCPGSRTS